ncbi:serine/threonine-protein phosphatase BSL2-like [Trifolium medium]|uniref:Serine/threonine-protein phosphatase BSL2-like n=1 Tax=Trifolium medium TaxID=97028 RepID=A0A392MJP2_9FABA|nr:serine/threonine-protein phosphatase BSL2-like [Trifolium medium]
MDTAAGVWCDTKSVVTTPRTGRYSADAAGGDAAVELTRRCRHAAAAVGDLIFIYGGLRGVMAIQIILCPLSNTTGNAVLLSLTCSVWLNYFLVVLWMDLKQ